MEKTNTISYEKLHSNDWTVQSLVMESQVNYETRLPLTNFVDINNKRINTSELSADQEYRYISISNIDNELNIIKNIENLKKNELPTRAKLLAQSGDILLSTIRPDTSGVALLDTEEEIIVSDALAVLTPKDKTLSKLIYFILTSKKVLQELGAFSRGTIKRITLKQLRKYSLPISNLSEEKKEYANKLYDKWVTANKNQNIISYIINDVIESSLLKTIVDQNGQKKNHMLINYEELTPQRYDIDYFYRKMFKPEWNVKTKKLGSLINFKTVDTTAGENQHYRNKIPRLKVNDLSKDLLYLKSNEVEFVDSKTREIEKDFLNKDDIIIPKIGDNFNRINLVPEELKGAIINQYLYAAETNYEKVLAPYIAIFLKSTWAIDQISINFKGTRRTINRKMINNIEIPLPDLKTQKDIINQITEVNSQNKIEMIQQEIKEFQEGLIKILH